MSEKMEKDIERCIKYLKGDVNIKSSGAKAAFASGCLRGYPELSRLLSFIADED